MSPGSLPRPSFDIRGHSNPAATRMRPTVISHLDTGVASASTPIGPESLSIIAPRRIGSLGGGVGLSLASEPCRSTGPMGLSRRKHNHEQSCIAVNCRSVCARERHRRRANPDVHSVKTRDGKDLKINLAPNLTVAAARAVTLADFKPGAYVGSTAKKNASG